MAKVDVVKLRRNIMRRAAYYRKQGVVIPTIPKAAPLKTLRAIERNLTKVKEDRAREKVWQRVVIHNVKNEGRVDKTLPLSRVIFETLYKNPKKRAMLVKAVRLATGPTKTAAKASSLFIQLAALPRTPKKILRPLSLRAAAQYFEDRERRKRHMPSFNEQRYYDSFLIASLRTGNYTMFRDAIKNGPAWVRALVDMGFEISDMYEVGGYTLEDDFILHPNFKTDEELEKMGVDLEHPERFDAKGLKDSEWAKEKNKMFERVTSRKRVGLRHRNNNKSR